MRKVMENIERLGRMSKLLVLGDALFYKLSKTKERWQPLEQRYAAINLGAPGDRTETILKRFEDGQHLLNMTSDSPTVLLQVRICGPLGNIRRKRQPAVWLHIR